LPFYDRQRATETAKRIVILDLSLLTAEVLENVTALVGRLVLEFLQRLGEYGRGEARGSVPVVLVLEEAQNYIKEQRSAEDESVSRFVFERVAREGRKFGLGLVVASQRPSELSKTVLSQCSSFVVHRLQNPEDLRYFREIVPASYAPLLEQLPALAPRTALVLGECVRAPVLVRIREAVPVPRSRDPRFYSYWVRDTVPPVDVEGICARWEGAEPAEPAPSKTKASTAEAPKAAAASQKGATTAARDSARKGVKPK
jgi:DNA helicase HerA-like ATPase